VALKELGEGRRLVEEGVVNAAASSGEWWRLLRFKGSVCVSASQRRNGSNFAVMAGSSPSAPGNFCEKKENLSNNFLFFPTLMYR
jgi:hypothetical protein